MSAKLFAIPLLIILALSPPAGAALPDTLARRLDEEGAKCGFRLASTGTMARLRGDGEYLRAVRREPGPNDFSINSVAATGLMMMVGGNLLMGAGTSTEKVASTVGGSGVSFLGYSVMGGALMQGQEDDLKKKKLGDSGVDAFASASAKKIAALAGIDPLRQEALRSEFVKVVRQKSERGDTSDIDNFAVLQAARYRGQPLLTPAELAALDDFRKRAGAPDAKRPTEKEKADFLRACGLAMRVQANDLKGDSRRDTVKVLESNAAFLKDLAAFEAAHPGEAHLLPAPKKAGNAGAESEGETSMEVR